MKTKLLALALVGLFTINGAMAQEQGDIRANAGLNYLFGPWGGDGRIGFGLGGEYLITDAISIAPSYYFSNKDDLKLNILNIDARYYFVTGDTQVYGKVGFASYGGDASESGLTLGAGGIFNLSDNLGLNAELDYGLSKPFDDAFGLGAKFGVVYTF
ncbi:MAG: outer membrane beta-barrel protein [Reichenbachiella sp.]|uniref:outer membrane beta-barrel protein n=1 Tax=Reichenbachiella sp. TaxID=2184521 RepID=UPI0032992FAB